MKNLKVLNQDRDIIVNLCDLSGLHIKTVEHNRKLLGFNVMYNTFLLGTFDTYEDAEYELASICVFRSQYYVVNGYCEGLYE